MDELDLLKKDWKKENQNYTQVSETDIYKMLHKNSSSTVKWILIIGIIEFMVWTGIGFFFNTDEYVKSIHAEEMMIYLKALTYFNYVVVLFFIYKFYQNYVKISATSSTKQLMKDILRTRKTVNYYVWYNLGMIVVSMILGFIMAFLYNPKLSIVKDKIANDASNGVLLKIICILTLATIIFVFVFWLFYKLLYGILLGRLKSNYKVLENSEI
jgi:ABC-type multidrug transport system fused ATPase/permease subunit